MISENKRRSDWNLGKEEPQFTISFKRVQRGLFQKLPLSYRTAAVGQHTWLIWKVRGSLYFQWGCFGELGRSGVCNPKDSLRVAPGEAAPCFSGLHGEQLSVYQAWDEWAGKRLKRGSFHPDPQNRVSNGKSDRPFTVVALLGAAIILSS